MVIRMRDGRYFLHIPKCGGSAFRRFHRAKTLVPLKAHSRASEYPEGAEIVALVRHPVDRLVSMWSFMRSTAPRSMPREPLAEFARSVPLDEFLLSGREPKIDRAWEGAIDPYHWWLDRDGIEVLRLEDVAGDFPRCNHSTAHEDPGTEAREAVLERYAPSMERWYGPPADRGW